MDRLAGIGYWVASAAAISQIFKINTPKAMALLELSSCITGLCFQALFLNKEAAYPSATQSAVLFVINYFIGKKIVKTVLDADIKFTEAAKLALIQAGTILAASGALLICAISILRVFDNYRYRSVGFSSDDRRRIETGKSPKDRHEFFYHMSASTNMLNLSSEDQSSASVADRRFSSSSTSGDPPPKALCAVVA